MATLTVPRTTRRQLRPGNTAAHPPSLLGRIEIAALWLAVVVTSTMWLAMPLIYHNVLPDLLANELPVFATLPAAILGCFSYFRFGGFAKSPAVLLAGLLMFIAILWTAPSEIHHGLSAAAIFAESLPITALINKHRYQRRLSMVFVVATVAADIVAGLDPAIGLHYGTITIGGLDTANSAGVSIQSALALMILMVSLASWSGNKGLRNAAALLLVPLIGTIAACGSRTAALALAGAIVYAFARWMNKDTSMALLFGAAVLIPVPLVILFIPEGFSNQISNLPIFSEQNGSFDVHLSERTGIYETAAKIVATDYNWLGGVGPGGVSARLGQESSLDFRQRDPDGVTRAYAHSTYVWVVLGTGFLGVLIGLFLLGQMFLQAFLLDRAERECKRVALVLFLTIAAAGIVFPTEFYWSIVSGFLWSMLTPQARYVRTVPLTNRGRMMGDIRVFPPSQPSSSAISVTSAARR